MATILTKRLNKELREMQTHGLPTGITIVRADDLSEWLLSVEVLGNTLYEGEKFCLRFEFPHNYPIDSPAVTFVADDKWTAPVHPHVYSNGHICASILGPEWSPVLSVVSVCLTLQSMLASCTSKQRPPDNDKYVSHAPRNPKNTRFHYDDDTV
ncbi:UBC-like protein [Dacryopinax primogenitus]|uniref:UBC-like protein n=1 Tax=Dacryopinax primogenitus (strain DJM 731) TaxID=1858805 RepID=M5G587_DACPD|nr:UBC-like protein [Dacryopinax primogenitus]EJT98922.1 UBC-like protein [Dacryopinax primogenitus]